MGAIFLGLFMVCTESKGQTHEEVKAFLNTKNKNMVRWFNSGMTDSIGELYAKNGCVLGNNIPKICGKEAISRNYAVHSSKGYKILDMYLETLSVADTIAVERGVWIIQVENENKYKGNYLTEWHYIDGSWLIVNDIGCAEKRLEE